MENLSKKHISYCPLNNSGIAQISLKDYGKEKKNGGDEPINVELNINDTNYEKRSLVSVILPTLNDYSLKQIKNKYNLLDSEIDSIFNDYNYFYCFIISSHNQSQFVLKNLTSVANLNYPKNGYRIIYINDNSTDNTQKVCEDFIKNNKDIEMLLINNYKRFGPAYSREIGYNKTSDGEICVFLDGDDFLIEKNTLHILSDTYQNNDIYATFGTMKDERWQYSARGDYNRDKNNFFPHLRTAYSFICKQVPSLYLKYHDEYFMFCSDIALFISILELCDFKFSFINTELVLYNNYNNLNNTITGHVAQNMENKIIRTKCENCIKLLPKLKSIIGAGTHGNSENKFIIFVPYCNMYSEFILECLNSVENQNYNNYEVIIVNDGGDITELNKFIENKSNYIILNFSENNGPAFSKWKFIEYIQKNLDKYSVNDICIILDGDDYLFNNALHIINNTYKDTKCWVTFGDATGKYCDPSRKYYKDPANFVNIRNSNWFANHPRTMKLFLLNFMKINDFKYNGKWMIKCTDRLIIYKVFELSGSNRIAYINDILYYYREHEFNSYKTVGSRQKQALLNYCNTQPKCDTLNEDIHIVMCCWKRYQNIEIQFEMLNNQTFSKRIHWHLVNNNFTEREKLEVIINDLKNKYKNIKVSISHYKNKYFGYQRFLYIRDHLLKKFILDYVIIIDDDQLYSNDWVEKMWNLRKPKIYSGWYCKKWIDNLNYWKGSIISYRASAKNNNKNIKRVNYVGTGGCIIDTTIFQEKSPFWIIPTDLPKEVNIYNIEDLWLSFTAKYEHGYKLERSFLSEYKSINHIDKNSKKVSLYSMLRNEKQLLFNYLIKKYPNLII